MLALALALVAQAPAAADEPHIVVRASVDPVVFAVAGYSVAGDVTRSDAHWRLELGAFHARVPEGLVPLVSTGPEHLVIDEDAVRIAALYDVNVDHSGLFFGPALFLYRLHDTQPALGLDAVAHEVYLHGTLGATFFPLPDHPLFGRFFVMPWATVGVPLFHGGSVHEDGVTVRDRVVNWHLTCSLGVRIL